MTSARTKTRAAARNRSSGRAAGKPGKAAQNAPRLVASHPAAGPKPGRGVTPSQADGVVLTPEQQRRRRARNVAIALTLGFLAVLFYAVTIVKLGPNVLNRPL